MLVEYSGNGLELRAYGMAIVFKPGVIYDVEAPLYSVLMDSYPSVFKAVSQNGRPVAVIRKPESVTDAMTSKYRRMEIEPESFDPPDQEELVPIERKRGRPKKVNG